MVGYDKKKEGKLGQFDFVLAGGGSGLITRALCQPLDVLKIRFQLQVEPISTKSVSKYQSLFQATSLIFKEEGLRAFWKGHVPAQWLSISYGVVQFWMFEVLTKQVDKLELGSKFTPMVNFTCGFAAGSAATVASFPFDVLRTRLVAQSEQNKIYKGVMHSLKEMYTKEGFLALFKGLWPTVLQIGPHAGAQFMCYKFFSDLYKKLLIPNKETTLSSSLFAGSLAGLCAKTVIYPFDLTKKRMQIQGFEAGRKSFGGRLFRCKSFTDCIVRIYQIEGVAGYFKGLSPSLIKAVSTSALHFSSYEMICQFLASTKARSEYKSKE